MKRRIMVTGCDGFIGRAVTQKLLALGHDVLGVGRCALAPGYECDLSDTDAGKRMLKDVGPIDATVHCAAIAHGQAPPDPFTIGAYNSFMLRNLVDAFGTSQPHWIFLSSIDVYGNGSGRLVPPAEISEAGQGPYGKGKLQDELFLQDRANALDILRIAPVYDDTRRNDLAKRVYVPNTLFKLCLVPSPLYRFCDVARVAEAVSASLERKGSKSVCHVCDAMPVRQKDVAATFPGIAFPFPALLLKLMMLCLPGRLSHVRQKIKKLGVDSDIEPGHIFF